MRVRGFCSFLMWTALYLMPSWNSLAETKAQVPEFGRNTVLVWEIPREDSSRTFVARLAGFYPDLLLESAHEIHYCDGDKRIFYVF